METLELTSDGGLLVRVVEQVVPISKESIVQRKPVSSLGGKTVFSRYSWHFPSSIRGRHFSAFTPSTDSHMNRHVLVHDIVVGLLEVARL